ncbi:MAG: flagellar hook-basal body protein [Bacilli bacterium]
MTAALNAAASGMNAFQQMMDVIGNNIANVNTTAYKSSSTNFEDLLSQTISSGSAGGAGIGGTNPIQVGLGVKVASVYTDFSQGSLTVNGVPSNLAINGGGFFMVCANQNGPNATTPPAPIYYTRAGDFSVDSNGYLVTPNGYYLMGTTPTISSTTTPTTPPTSINPPTTNQPALAAINVNEPGATSPTPGNYTIGPNGLVTVPNVTSGGANNYYYIPLVNVENPNGLVKAGNSLYQASSATLPGGTTVYSAAGTGTAGQIQQGALEGSNVNLTSDMSNMIIAQTGYESNSKVINTVSQMDQFMLQQV